MNLTKKKTALVALGIIGVFIAGLVAGFMVWQYTTELTVLEPFEVTTDLPMELEVYPDVYHYTISVTNHGAPALNAVLYYTIEKSSDLLDVNITPANGTSLKVDGGTTVTFDITIDLDIDGAEAPATVTIGWWIERMSP